MKNIFLSSTLAVIGLVSTTWADGFATPTLTDHFTFDGTYNSVTSSGRVADAPMWCYVPVGTDDGVIGGAASFDGMSMLSVTDTTVLPSSGGWTVSFWEKSSFNNNSQGFFISDAAENPYDVLYLQNYQGSINGKAASTAGQQITGYEDANTSLPTDGTTWMHHVISLQENGITNWFVNGALQGWQRSYPGDWQGLSTTPVDATHETGLGIGGSPNAGLCYEGLMDDLQIYDGGVSPEMASYLYNNPGATLAGFTPSTNTPTTKSVLRWTFDSDFSEAGAGPAATSSGATIDTTGGAYAGSNAAYFDGNSSVTIPGSVLSGNAFSLSTWVKATNNTTGMFLCDTGGWERLFMRYYNESGDRWITGWLKKAFTQEMGQDGPHQTSFEDDVWVQLTMTMREDGIMTYYLNGEKSSWLSVPVWEGLRDNLLLGAGSDGTSQSFQFEGWMDDLQIYDYTLSDTEVASLYATPGSVIGQTPNIAGDANNDGQVDGSDVTILAGNWQKGVSDGLTASWEEGDFNGDGQVDGSDVTILAGNWQYGVEATAAAVPEPSMLLLLLCGIVVGILRRPLKR